MADLGAGAFPPTGANIDELLIRQYGSFLHNVRPGKPGVCQVCSAPVDRFVLCRACNQIAQARGRGNPSPSLADRVAFLTYALEGGQACSILSGYKKPAVSSRYWTAAATWVLWFLERHAHCAHRLAGSANSTWAWATVPSVRSGRKEEHPLHQIVRRIWGLANHEIPMRLAPGAGTQGRDYSPERFLVEQMKPGTHVILIDDSWTTGGNIQSAATALKRAGAGQVSAMVLGRILNESWQPTAQFIKSGGLRTPFNPEAWIASRGVVGFEVILGAYSPLSMAAWSLVSMISVRCVMDSSDR